MGRLNWFALLMVISISSPAWAVGLVCAKVPMFVLPFGALYPSIGGDFVRGQGFYNKFVTVKIYSTINLGNEDTLGDVEPGSCFKFAVFPHRPDYYYSSTPVNAADLMTSDLFFNFISTENEFHNYNRVYDSWSFEQPRIIKLTPQSGASFYAVVSKMVERNPTRRDIFYAGYEVTNPSVEGTSYIPCAAMTQTYTIVNWRVPGLVQVQLDSADAMNSTAFIRLAENPSANRQILDCVP